MASPRNLNINMEEMIAAIRALGSAGLTANQAAVNLHRAMANLGSTMKQEAKSDVIKLKKIVVKPPKYRLIRDD